MKYTIALIFILPVICFGQKKETLKTVQPNKVQLERLIDFEKKINELSENRIQLIELVIGYKRDEVDSLSFDDKGFHFVVKKK